MRCKWTSKDRIAMEKQSNSQLKKNTAAFKRCICPNVWIKIESTNQLLSKLIVLLNGRVPLLCQLWNQSRCLHRKIGIRCLIQRMQIKCWTGPHRLLCEKWEWVNAVQIMYNSAKYFVRSAKQTNPHWLERTNEQWTMHKSLAKLDPETGAYKDHAKIYTVAWQ